MTTVLEWVLVAEGDRGKRHSIEEVDFNTDAHRERQIESDSTVCVVDEEAESWHEDHEPDDSNTKSFVSSFSCHVSKRKCIFLLFIYTKNTIMRRKRYIGLRSVSSSLAPLWDTAAAPSLTIFRKRLKTHIFNCSFLKFTATPSFETLKSIFYLLTYLPTVVQDWRKLFK